MESVHVAIVGAGVSGLGLAARLRATGERSFAVLERDSGLGGTWRANTYPGAACDVQSHLYSFSFAPNAGWSRRYPRQTEILGYLERVADEKGLTPHLRFNAEVKNARFDPAARRWRLELGDGSQLDAAVLVTACGQLSEPHVPDFEGIDSFRGARWHSARWDHQVDPAGKRVAVIGSGASAIQIVPELAAVAGHLDVFQRTPPWIIRRGDRRFLALERRLFAAVPPLRNAYRSYIYWWLESHILGFRPDTAMARFFTWTARRHLEGQVADPALRAKLLPDYPLGCKRVLLSDDYYPALQRPGVELVTEAIERFVPEGIRTRDGRTHALDAVVFATGFDSQSMVAPMRVEGPDGRTLDDLWSDGPQAHLGVAVAGMPNLFMLYGPNTNLGHNSIIFMIERQIGYVLDLLAEMRRRGAALVDVRPDVMERSNERLQERLRDSVWNSGCTNWYRNENGRITNNWAGPTLTYWWAMRQPRMAEYTFA